MNARDLGDDELESNGRQLKESSLGRLIFNLNIMAKNISVEADLSGVLDTFMEKLNESQMYLSNGIVNTNFSEAALLLQSSVEIYGKKVDILWDSALEYQHHLCVYDKNSEENAEVQNRLEERINRYKRKKIAIEQSEDELELFDLDYDELLKEANSIHSSKLSECSELVHIWKKWSSQTQVPIEIDYPPRYVPNLPLKRDISCLKSKKKICDYKEMLLNSILPYILYSYNDLVPDDKPRNGEPKISSYERDCLLQKYLVEKNITVEIMWEKKLSSNFQRYLREHMRSGSLTPHLMEMRKSLCPKDSVIHLNRLPSQVMEHLQNNTAVANDIVDWTTPSQTPIQNTSSHDNMLRKNSELISDNDSAFHDVSLSHHGETEEDIRLSQRSDCTSLEPSMARSEIASRVSECGTDRRISDAHPELADFSCVNINTSTLEQDVQFNISGKQNVGLNVIMEENVQLNIAVHSDVQLNFDVDDDVQMNVVIDETPHDDVCNVTDICDEDDLPLSVLFGLHIPITSRKRKKDDINEDYNGKLKRFRRVNLKIQATASNRKFEKFFAENYNPENGEGKIIPVQYSDSEDDDNVDILLNNFGEEVEARNVPEIQVNPVTEILPNFGNEITSTNLDDSAVPESINSTSASNIENSCAVEPPIHVEVSRLVLEPILSLPGPSTRLEAPPSEEEIEKIQNSVSEWKSFIDSKLRDTKKKLDFDIHEYGTNIMNSIPQNNKLKFNDLVENKTASEVSRYFLASLQLANTYNVQLCHPCDAQLANDKFVLKLLTRDRYHEHLNDYHAPSEETFRERLARMQALNPQVPVHSTPVTANAKKIRYVNSKKQKLFL